jgi:predicted NBD/HSP70 family sugar kinase
VDPDKGIAVDYKYIQGWRNVPLAEPLAERFGVPVYLENTTRSMALAELWFGQGRGVSDWVCIGIRSGVGAGIVAGGQLQRGAHFQSGEIGRWRCPWPEQAAARFFTAENSERTQDTELQEIASARALLAAWDRAQKTKPGTSGRSQWSAVAEMARAAEADNELTTRIIGVAAETLGWAVSQLAFALNPSRVIFAGPLTLLGDTLLEPIRRRARDILQRCGTDVPTMVNSIMGEYGGALGAAALAVHEWKPTCSRS